MLFTANCLLHVNIPTADPRALKSHLPLVCNVWIFITHTTSYHKVRWSFKLSKIQIFVHVCSFHYQLEEMNAFII